ncbi:lytic transglycosylase domain-containing protein [Lysinibacillus pakistanensis]|uniref:Lytic transglycosylase domain-containing protein n=1 Tax=Lysinibacillus pakistanensis TaxID=759811 RepID=A0AAX3WSB2_9BACI|nr:lytic transglycosylase domain-containing protein [Lysinibacillus pakistanensis]MDM5234060.1 lytic transglycosylase domain-containing protein [Lysinibacillus pakistanensis]WHY44662.1 lytic transglycosylase domain-containing protein [Lysinibacillus pakistanensis]WHY49668.1 lytic transglycosylase domain-containing protein [Lysinibacillus pakistanensis]
MTKNMKKKPLSSSVQMGVIALLIPIAITVYVLAFFAWRELQTLPIFEKIAQQRAIEDIQQNFDMKIPEQFIPIYVAAEEKYGVPWTLLAAHHRIETRFSSMKSLVSPAGAEGPMQFMPCTFVGWKHPSCSGLGKGNISKTELMSPEAIKKYGGYGVDANGDGIADPYDIEDAIYSAANYLSKNGAANGDVKQAVFQYNHSDEYVEKVLHYFNLYNDYHDELKQAVLLNDKK